MKKSNKIFLSVFLTAVLLATVILACLSSLTNTKAFTKGTYVGTFNAFAESENTDAIGESKYMLSVQKDYILLATALYLDDASEYSEIGYYVTKDGAKMNDKGLSSNSYYTGITIKTSETTTKTWAIADIFKGDENVTGMIVAEIRYSETHAYTIQPYATKNGGAEKVVGATREIMANDFYKANYMSFNIRTNTTGDSGARSWANRALHVVDLINKSGADVICLQEVKPDQIEYINAKMLNKYSSVYYSRDTATYEGLAIIYNTDAYDLISSDRYWLSETPDEQSLGWDETYYRICVTAQLVHRATRQQVTVVNTHGPLNNTANENAYKLIMERSVTGKNFTFLCGDFNATTDMPAYSVVGSELTDSKYVATTTENNVTYNGWGAYTGEAEGDLAKRVIDYCFVSGDSCDVLTYDVLTGTWGDNGENFISDHYPVQITLNVNYKRSSTTKPPVAGNDGFDGDLDLAN